MIHAGRHACKHTYSYFDHTTGHTSGHTEEQANVLQEMTCAACSRAGPNLQTVAWHWLHFARWHQISPYYGGAMKMCQRKGAIHSSSSDLLISERFPWKNGDREGARHLFSWATDCFFYMWRTSFNNSPKSVRHSVAFQESVCLLTLFYFLLYNKQNKRLPSLCPWISQICRKWQMFRCHS